MVSRFSLIFWRWVVEVHDRLHDARDKAVREAITEKYGTWDRDKGVFVSETVFTTARGSNVTYDLND